MLIVVACDGLEVARRFDGAECYCCYSVDKGVLSGCRTLPSLRLSTQKTAATLASFGASVVICGFATSAEAKALESEGIDLVTGVSGLASAAASDYLVGAMRGVDEDLDDEE